MNLNITLKKLSIVLSWFLVTVIAAEVSASFKILLKNGAFAIFQQGVLIVSFARNINMCETVV